ncbi:hypothetical protein ASPWEDRAFT_182838 [Aspergillus wentii DTO 134E9]|uniref:ABC1 atypical kinase-like domain-containing protein n=1 Tax=Aspergillus wentii DTO 134E9 TaxID=1073089 RepID=A0A1L9RID2_ASPWE|nr:uncharacterized protein ASPWEDRAFT_182838 [Aspergillus wentii DTO 134E9]OJJ34690.1 hypothetical protein ASPWEDRAFT_182838 [Aspergillus wentii DTO 134E9]
MEIPSTELPKPPIPYVKGWRFTVQSHTPPPPTPVTQNGCCNSMPEIEERRDLSAAERCLQNPPLPGKAGSTTLELEIVHLLKVKDGTNAQVFVINIIGSNPESSWPGQKVVAKVYDPLYHDDDDGYLNSFRCVDKHYTHEVASYENLSEFQGDAVPTFYGSYSLDIPVEGLGVRTVRLILVEYIPGILMKDANPQDFSQSARQQVMKKIIDFETDVYFKKDMCNEDISPRNVIMHPEGKLVYIDFANVLFGRKTDDYFASTIDMFLGQYISPLLRWTNQDNAWDFQDWIDWDWEPWVKAEYAHTADTITQEQRERYDS